MAAEPMAHAGRTAGGPQTRFVACEVFRDELAAGGIDPRDCLFLEQGLHRYPDELNRRLAEALAEVESRHAPERIVLVYGLCGGGLENIGTMSSELVVARVQDCIPLFVGREPKRFAPDGKGIFYLSRGWIEYGKTPYTEYQALRRKYGHEDAYWSCSQMLRMYGRVAYVHTTGSGSGRYVAHARRFADFFHLEFSEIRGDSRLLRALLKGGPHRDILRAPPGRVLTREDFQADREDRSAS